MMAKRPELIPNWGAGMFPDETTRSCSQHAFHSITTFLNKDVEIGEISTSAINEDATRVKLLCICGDYISNSKYDNRPTAPVVKKQLRSFYKEISRTLEVLETLSTESRKAINAETVGSKSSALTEPEDKVDELRRLCQTLLRAMQATTDSEPDDVRNIAVTNAVRELLAIRENITGRNFSRNLEEVAPPPSEIKAGRPRGFEKRDAQFVYEVLKSIDRKVTFAAVRTAFRKL